jgi:hypothetical protein
VENFKASPLTLKILRDAGWSPSRRFDTADYEKALRDDGYVISPAVLQFMRSFGGLQLRHPNSRVPGKTLVLSLDARKATAGVASGWARSYERRLRRELCAFGTAEDGYLLLVMDPDGGVHAGYDDVLLFVGNSGIEAIDNLCCGRDMPEIPD